MLYNIFGGKRAIKPLSRREISLMNFTNDFILQHFLKNVNRFISFWIYFPKNCKARPNRGERRL